ncbi:unnamed protein product [Didymodactylos carnosus]|uniref:Uncharacterized protein n=1 Tax=Didymodactylos carnosus TaxID=1234261 RepID=A0A814MSQ7_9BILA|nr:unnamed protein product [Didymodactylos carnosus]CAF3849133.1 unnamed protein product [Didymodactylos carnosus]
MMWYLILITIYFMQEQCSSTFSPFTNLCLLVQTNYSCRCLIPKTLYCYNLKLDHIPQLPLSNKFIQWNNWILAKNNFKYLSAHSFIGHTIHTIDLDSNYLSTIDINAFMGINGSSLRQLILSNNNLSYLHLSIFKHIPNLQTLILNGNRLQSLTFTQLNNLEVLELDQQKNDKDEFLPNLSAITSLLTLSLKFNRIKYLSSSHIFPSSLQSLKLTGNFIRHLSSRLFRFVPNLRYLYLDSNRIETIDSNAFLDIKYLLELNLAGNRFKTIPTYFVLEKLPYLKIFNLSFNQLTILLPNSFDTLLNLEELDLGQNQIYSLSSHTFCTNKSRFQQLSVDLSSNSLTTIDYCTFSNKNIKFINVGYSRQLRCSCSLDKLKLIDQIELKGYCNSNQHIMSSSNQFEKCLNWTNGGCKNSCERETYFYPLSQIELLPTISSYSNIIESKTSKSWHYQTNFMSTFTLLIFHFSNIF